MLFQLYSSHASMQLIGWVLVFVGLILMNEIGRRTKAGGMLVFVIIPTILTFYFIAAHLGAFGGSQNPTVAFMDGWFHYFKLYAADIGCVGFMMIKYKWGIGKEKWFAWFPWFIVAANIMIANVSDMESAIAAAGITGDLSGAWWASNEGVFIYGGWWNVVNALAGLINIFCMTGCIRLYTSKDKNHADMLWPDMTWQFILAYDVWNFEYTYLNLPLHTWYCGVALLLAPTFANAFWNKGGWIQNRANTLALWCMFAQVFPAFQNHSRFTTLPVIYADAAKFMTDATGRMDPNLVLSAADANPKAQGVVAIAAIAVNILVMTNIIKRAKEQKKNPYTNEIFVGTRDYKLALERTAEANKAA